MSIGEAGRNDLLCWYQNLETSRRKIRCFSQFIEFRTDASNLGCGGVCGDRMTNGRRSDSNSRFHINVLELLAVLYTLQTMFSEYNTNFKLYSDNTTAIAYINRGGRTWSRECNDVAKRIWFWCQPRQNRSIASFIPGWETLETDSASRHFSQDTEWSPNPLIFKAICKNWFKPEVDLFASKENHLLQKYVSWSPDPNAIASDAFTLNWAEFESIFLFPPFRLLLRCIQKIRQEKPRGILVASYRPTQPWFSAMQTVTDKPPLLFKRKKGNLRSKLVPSQGSHVHLAPLLAIVYQEAYRSSKG